MKKSKTTKGKSAATVPLEQIVRLRRECKMSAKWYRGDGFKHNDEQSKARREAKADTFDWCADELEDFIRKARRA